MTKDPQKGARFPRGWLRRALLLTAATYVSALPFIHYAAYGPLGDLAAGRRPHLSRSALFESQALLALLLIFASAAAGFLLGPRCGLPGFWKRDLLRRDALWLAAAGLFIGLGAALLYDRPILARTPWVYPDGPGVALLFVAKSIFLNDVVFRFGVLTLLFAATREFWSANILAAALYVSRIALDRESLGLASESVLLPAAVLASAFLFALFKGWLYRGRGLAACLLLQTGVSLRYLILQLF